jgi:hypothetical protein
MIQGTLVLESWFCAYDHTFQGGYRFVYMNDTHLYNLYEFADVAISVLKNTWAGLCCVNHLPASSGRVSSLEGSSTLLPVRKQGGL